jgi:hypothetical protein
VAVSEGYWRGRVTELERQAANQQLSEAYWHSRVTELERQAAEPLHTALMKAMLASVWIRRASRLMPAPVRRLVRYGLLAWDGQ